MTAPTATLGDRILAHLKAYPIPDEAADVPREVTQEGIADALGARVAHVSRALKSLISQGLVFARLAHPQGGVRRARAHALTAAGWARAAALPPAALERPRAPSPAPPPSPPPAGRAKEFQALLDALEEVRASGPRFALVEGDAGAGKTRLLQAFARAAEARGARVLSGQASPTGSEQLVGPVGPALEPLGFERRFRARNAGTPRERALAAAAESLEVAARYSPVALLLDDLHYAGPSVAEFLHGLLLALEGARVLVVGAVRREEAWEVPNWPLYTALLPLRGEPHAKHVDLGPLDRAGVAALLEDAGVHVLGERPLPDDLVDRVWRESGGNATFALGMGQEFADGVAEEDFFPPSVRAAAKAHFANVPSRELEALQLAAVVGPEMAYPTLRGAYDGDEEDLVRTLDALIDRLLLEEVPGSGADLRLRFRHPKVREAVLADLTATRRQYLEQKVAQAHQA